ncbi:hypothetical protein LUZ63_021719 [Rhynchospora breviuscula]|uniref:Phosphatase n=1 Tax=Rhynchospora breviuscula TaxID=2022672 RepID=A0A9Q0BZL0_9POAL|nr:hypothetical protein LUZ63_021719 [Rhynchospora breviuscula]
MTSVNTAPVPLPSVGKQLIVFDFDWSLVDQDTDRWVHEVLCPELRAELQRRKKGEQFTDLCADLLLKLHARAAVTPDELRDALRLLPFHPGVKRAISTLKQTAQPNTTLFLLSNSNTVYINTILAHHNLEGLFDEIVTNPAHFTPEGALKLERRIAPSAVQHTCSVGCSANMCKGDELEAFLERHGGRDAFDRIIYVGDGGQRLLPRQEAAHERPGVCAQVPRPPDAYRARGRRQGRHQVLERRMGTRGLSQRSAWRPCARLLEKPPQDAVLIDRLFNVQSATVLTERT